ncbi:hypothetical protein, partial [Parasutterella excrementihominis]|uniref:hypothetical protein n=1 Tax=Parasutterella excrementihominis TaxID=487175 RepID=UPI0026670658
TRMPSGVRGVGESFPYSIGFLNVLGVLLRIVVPRGRNNHAAEKNSKYVYKYLSSNTSFIRTTT